MRVGLVVLLLLVTHIAHADELRLLVEREPGAGACPDAAELSRRVTTLLAREAFSDAAAETLVVRLRGEADVLHADIFRVGDAGLAQQRTLRTAGPDCASLAEALVLALALAVDPSYFDAPLARREPEPEPEPVAQEPPPSSPAPAPAPPRPVERWRGVELAVGGLVVAGEAPDPSLGLALHAAWVRPRFALGLELGARTTAEQAASPGGITVRPWRLAALPCLRLGPASACGLAALTLVVVRGQALENAQRDESLILVAGGRLAWDFAVSPGWILRPYAEGGGQLVRARVRVLGESVWDSPLGVIGGGIALVVRID